MHRAVKHFRSYVDDVRGVTAIEYGLIASIISIATTLVALQIGTNLQIIFQQAADMM
jgi:Flp pilus assembly pilin Flp